MKKYSFDRSSQFKIEFLYILEFDKNNEYCRYEMRIFADQYEDSEKGVPEYIELISKDENFGKDYNYYLSDSYNKL